MSAWRRAVAWRMELAERAAQARLGPSEAEPARNSPSLPLEPLPRELGYVAVRRRAEGCARLRELVKKEA